MSPKLLEKEIEKQSKLLDKEIPGMLSGNSLLKGKFIAFYDGASVVGDTHKECFTKAEKKFGDKSAFVVDEITDQKLFVSALIKL